MLFAELYKHMISDTAGDYDKKVYRKYYVSKLEYGFPMIVMIFNDFCYILVYIYMYFYVFMFVCLFMLFYVFSSLLCWFNLIFAVFFSLIFLTFSVCLSQLLSANSLSLSLCPSLSRPVISTQIRPVH